MRRTCLRGRTYKNFRIPLNNGNQRCPQYMIIICIVAANPFYGQAAIALHQNWMGIYPVIMNDPFVFVGKGQADSSLWKPIAIAKIRDPFIKIQWPKPMPSAIIYETRLSISLHIDAFFCTLSLNRIRPQDIGTVSRIIILS